MSSGESILDYSSITRVQIISITFFFVGGVNMYNVVQYLDCGICNQLILNSVAIFELTLLTFLWPSSRTLQLYFVSSGI